MARKLNTKHSRNTIKTFIGVMGIALLVVVCIFTYKASRKESPDVVQGKLMKPTPSSNPSSENAASTSSQDSSKPVETSVPPAGSTSAQAQPNNLSTPILAKSSGNNGSIPSGVLINFTCTSTPGYFCEIKLEKPGSSPVVLEKKVLIENRGTAAASWNWESTNGTWNVSAVLSNSSGQAKSSAAQSLEVK